MAEPPRPAAEVGEAHTLASDLVSLHLPRTRQELAACTGQRIARLLGATAATMLVNESDERRTVELVHGQGCPWTPGATLGNDDAAWPPATGIELPLRYRGEIIGGLLLATRPSAAVLAELQHLLTHYGVALVNLGLREEALRTTDAYCASLQAFEEGVVLFQEQDPRAIGARFLDLCSAALDAQGGAVYVLEKIGDRNSPLHLEHAWGLPETILGALQRVDGGWWPGALVHERLTFLQRSEVDRTFPMLDNELVPAPLQNVVGAPLRYHGVDVGVCLLCNVRVDATVHTRLESSQRLFELGAAVFHRRELEAEAMRSKEFATQLDVAARLQRRLIPDQAPASPHYDFAWESRPARFIGGDYVDLFTVDDDVVAVIADVSGHGLNSALVMTSFRATYRSESRMLPPPDLLASANEKVRQEVGDTGMFLTCATVRLRAGGKLGFASAGHNPVYLYRHEEDRLEALDSSGPPLGFFPDVSYAMVETRAAPGDVLVMYTDGIVEATATDDDEMFGNDRLEAVIRDQAANGATAVRDAILHALREFTGGKPQEDDVSILVARIR